MNESTLFKVTLDRAEAMALPVATFTKVRAEFKLFGFGYANANKDGFLAEDVTDEAIQTLVGSPIYVARNLDSHPKADAVAPERAPYQIGTVTEAEKRADGVFCVASLMRDWFGALGINPKDLPEIGGVSMETTFDRTRAKYKLDGQIMSYREALAVGIASPLGQPDDSARYDCRFIIPSEYHGVALLLRAKAADREARFLRVAAGVDKAASIDPFDSTELDLDPQPRKNAPDPFKTTLPKNDQKTEKE